MSLTPEQIASLKTQVEAHEARKVHRRDVKYGCDRCGEKLATLRGRQRGDEVHVLGLELAVGLVPAGRRRYGPPQQQRPSKRTGDRLIVTKPGPVTITCPRLGCGREQVVVIPRGHNVDS